MSHWDLSLQSSSFGTSAFEKKCQHSIRYYFRRVDGITVADVHIYRNTLNAEKTYYFLRNHIRERGRVGKQVVLPKKERKTEQDERELPNSRKLSGIKNWPL